MDTLATTIEQLRVKLEKHRREDFKEYPTRVVFVDPLLHALGWDVKDPEEVELEYTTIDGKAVDYALKINRRPVMFVEAKPLNDPLTDVKAISQVVSYTAIAGIEWCILTNGATYKVYRSTEKAKAPDKLLFEVSLDARETPGMSIEQIAGLLRRFSRDSVARGVLDELGEQIFTTGKIRKALDRLFLEPPDSLVKLVRATAGDDSLKPSQVREALRRLWPQKAGAGWTQAVDWQEETAGGLPDVDEVTPYVEEHHLDGRPQEVLELYRTIERYCTDLDPAQVRTRYLAKYVAFSDGKRTFCSVHVLKSGLRVWLKLRYADLVEPPAFARDVSRIGHWGVGDVELSVDSLERLEDAKRFILQSFEANRLG